VKEEEIGKQVYCISCLGVIRKWQEYLKLHPDSETIIKSVENFTLFDQGFLLRVLAFAILSGLVFVGSVGFLPGPGFIGYIVGGLIAVFIIQPLLYRGQLPLYNEAAGKFLWPFIIAFLITGLVMMEARIEVILRFPIGFIVGSVLALSWTRIKYPYLKRQAIHSISIATTLARESGQLK
jgi:hypothetical protein